MTERTRQPKGIPTGGEFAAEVKVENADLLPGTTPLDPLEAIVYHPRLQNERCDISSVLASLDPAEHAALAERIGVWREASWEDWHRATDPVNRKARDMGLIAPEASLMIHPAATDDWLANNPAWVEDGKTPHPVGGYVKHYSFPVVEGYLDENGRPHRLDGPSNIYRAHDGSWREEYRIHGALSREDNRPARIESNGQLEWWLNDKRYAMLTVDGDISPEELKFS